MMITVKVDAGSYEELVAKSQQVKGGWMISSC